MRVVFFSWVFLMPFFQILLGINVFLVSGQCLNNQRLLLIQLKNSLKYIPSMSSKLVFWNQTDCCRWEGVTCNGAGQVTGLNLNNESITGGIDKTSSLFSLQFLRELNLAYNNFNSTEIPNGLVNLTGLTYLNLSNAGFGGQIPIEISRMTRLATLDFSTIFADVNLLKLESPKLSMLVQNLTEITELRLDGVYLSNTGSEWCKAISSALPNLRVLSMSNCNLSGPIDSSLAKLKALSEINLSQNNLNTSVPEFFADFRNLTVLHLSSCKLYGSFPEMVFQIQTLQTLDLSNNQFLHGSLPEFPTNASLQTLILGMTKFSGRLPDSIGNLMMLSWVELVNCNFSGPIPESLARLSRLVYIDFSFNNFSGSIPQFSLSKNLTQIILSHNDLTGNISSSHWDGLNNLINLDLRSNSLNGNIPASLFSLPSLQKLQLSNNFFYGHLNNISIAFTVLLDTLDLSSNKLTGPIPSLVFELRGLKFLSLSSNNFSGYMDLLKIQNLKNLTSLDLSYNNLSIDATGRSSDVSSFSQITTLKLASCNLGAIPNFLNLSKLIYLDFSNNQIHGKIPKWVWNIGNGLPGYLNLSHNKLMDFEGTLPLAASNLIVIDLHSNLLQGQVPILAPSALVLDYSNNRFSSIPAEIGYNMSSTIFFSLSNNNINGIIPSSLCNASFLEVLDLSNNRFSGIIPQCVIQMGTVLGVLNLQSNRLNGIIPEAFPNNCVIKTLDVNGNELEGHIPKSLASCGMLEVLNLGNNKLYDEFPCFLRNSTSLRVLVLRSNKFHGNISCRVGNQTQTWPNLQIIDIASNNFNGDLPPGCFLHWSAMMELKIRHLHFEILKLSGFYYQDTVTVTNKGLEMNLVKILTVFTSIDFSKNNFTGVIPNTIGNLKSLYVLNLSHNALKGPIPISIGNLTQLESLDLSVNQLSGKVPAVLTSLTFLSLLNLSFNHLIGRIPTGNQLETFTIDSYLGNKGLCGFPFNNTFCNETTLSPTSYDSGLIAVKSQFDWYYIVIGLGYGVGVAMVVGPLTFCKQGRELCSVIFHILGFIYTRHDDGKLEEKENIQEEQEQDADEEKDETEEEKSASGKYCVFCTKLDIHTKKAVHNPKCTCHSFPTTSSSFS